MAKHPDIAFLVTVVLAIIMACITLGIATEADEPKCSLMVVNPLNVSEIKTYNPGYFVESIGVRRGFQVFGGVGLVWSVFTLIYMVTYGFENEPGTGHKIFACVSFIPAIFMCVWMICLVIMMLRDCHEVDPGVMYNFGVVLSCWFGGIIFSGVFVSTTYCVATKE
jgi:hypothetical protein